LQKYQSRELQSSQRRIGEEMIGSNARMRRAVQNDMTVWQSYDYHWQREFGSNSVRGNEASTNAVSTSRNSSDLLMSIQKTFLPPGILLAKFFPRWGNDRF
jgi:hypothetical protein